MRRRWLFVALFASLGAAVGLVLWIRTLQPWLARPDGPARTIDERWRQVAEWARSPPATPGGGELISAAASLSRQRAEVEGRLGNRPTLPRVSPSDLAPEARAALDLLLAWNVAGGPTSEVAFDQLDPRSLLALSRLGIAAAEGEADLRLVSSLRLARELRRRGTLLLAGIGGRVSHEALLTAQDRGFAIAGAFRELRPTGEELFSAMARESLLVYGRAEQSLLALPSFAGYARWDEAPRGLPVIDVDRELLMLRKLQSDRLVAAHSLRDHPRQLLAAMGSVSSGPLRSALLELAVPDMTKLLGTWVDSIELYDGELAKAN